MRKLLKVLGILVGLVVALIVAAVIILPMIFDPNDYRDEISALVKEQTGRELTISGDLKLSVFPWLGVAVGGVQLSNAPGFGAAPFVALGGAEVRLKLMPLLRKEVEMSTVSIRQLQVNLARNAKGVTNWDDLIKATAGAETAPKTKPQSEPTAEGGVALAALAIGGLEVIDGQLSWRDDQAGAGYKVSKLNLTTGAIVPGKPLAVSFETDFAASQPKIDGHLGLDTTVEASADFQQITLRDLAIRLLARGADLPGGKVETSLKSQVKADLKAQSATLSALEIALYNLLLKGDVAVKNFAAPTITANLSLPAFSLRELMPKLQLEVPETSDDSTLTKVALATKIEATTDSVKLSDLRIDLDQTSITGQAAVNNFAKPAIRFDMGMDAIDVDRYLPPTKEVAATPGESAAAGAGQLPMETLRALDVDGQFKVGKLQASGLTTEAVVLKVKALNGQLRMHPFTARLYDGNYAGDVRLDVRGDEPQVALNEKLSGVQISPLLVDLLGEDRIAGAATIEAKLTAVGVEPVQIKRTLNGNGRVSFADGAFKGANIGNMIRRASAKMKGEEPPPKDAANQTDFTALGGTFTIVNGLISNTDLSMMSPLLRIAGGGKADLKDDSIDYRLKVAVVGSTKGQGGADADELKGLTVPLKIGGTFLDPKFKLDFQSAALDEAKAKAQAALDAQKAKLAAEKKALADKVAAEKAALEQRKAEERAKLDARRAEEEAKAKAKADAEKEALKKKASDKLKGLFK
jgi:AsmA protein